MRKTRFFSFFMLALLLSINTSFAQKSLKEANKAFDTENYFDAITLYKKAASKDKNVKAEAYYKVAECYRIISNVKMAEPWYDRAIKAGYAEPSAILKYADILRSAERYDEAIEQYNSYLAKMPDDQQAKNAIEGCKLSKEWKNGETRYKVENMKVFNSRNSDYAPTLYKNNGIVFTSSREDATGKKVDGRTGEEYSDLFESYIDAKTGKWSAPKILEGTVNSPYNEGASCFNKAGSIMYFTLCSNKEGRCKIVTSKKQGANWSEPQTLGLFGDTTTVGQPYLSQDEKTLYFVATNAVGGLGGRDIWMVSKEKANWGQPVNLGATINTVNDELFPFLNKDGMLYFASNGHPGMGGLDLFVSKPANGAWSKPENLLPPFNSGGDDFGYVSNAKRDKGFFSSNRDGGRGGDDIWQWILTPLEFTLSGFVRDDSTGKAIARAEIKLIMQDSTYIDTITDVNGKYSFKLKENVAYTVMANKKEYFGATGEVSTVGQEFSKAYTLDLNLKAIPKVEITLKDILYDFNSDVLREESKVSLNTLVKIMKDSPNLKIGIYSHTDSRGSDEYNLELSQRRAQSVVNYLVSQGLSKDRLLAKGFGETQLLNKCANGIECTEQEHEVNRRTTFKVLSTDYKGTIIYKRVTGQEERTEGSNEQF